MTAIPPRRILAAIDFSDTSRTALSLGVRLAWQCRAELHVLYAEDPLLAAAARAQGIDLDGESREQLATFSRSVQVEGAEPLAQHVIVGDAWAVIRATAERLDMDLIVMGMHGMSGVQHLMFGSVAERVLRRTDTSVLVVPSVWSAPDATTPGLAGIGPVVAAVDFSDDSRAALMAAAHLAAALDTSLEATHVITPPGVLARWQRQADAAVQDRLESATRELETLVRDLKSPVPVQCRVVTGDVPDRMAAAGAPAPGRSPILVVGSRGHTERTPGATAYRIIGLATAPVLVHVA